MSSKFPLTPIHLTSSGIGVLFSLSLLLTSCHSVPSPSRNQSTAPKLTALQAEKDFKKRWYLAQRDPDIYCPVGYPFNPSSQKSFAMGAATFECISVADGSIRFYIPDDAQAGAYRKEALAYREASKSIPLKTREKLSQTSGGLMSGILRTIVFMVSGPPG